MMMNRLRHEIDDKAIKDVKNLFKLKKYYIELY